MVNAVMIILQFETVGMHLSSGICVTSLSFWFEVTAVAIKWQYILHEGQPV
jgi:hypothetical protein